MRHARYIGISLLFILAWTTVSAQEGNKAKSKPQGPPPAVVVTAKTTSGMVHPQTEFVGTVYYPEVSQLASEVKGRVEEIRFEDGERIVKGQVLVSLSTDLLEKDLDSALSLHEKVLTDIEKADTDLRRLESLFQKQSLAEKEYDEARFTKLSLEKQALALKAEADRLGLEIRKARIKAPYDGVVLEGQADRGEWLSPGSPVATVARDDYMEAVVEVPEEVLRFVELGTTVEVAVGGSTTSGEVFAVIPRGDIATRTFPVKIKVKDSGSLAQGMEARVRLPSGPKSETVIVNRDAVIQSYGNFVVWVVREGKALPVPVQVAAYEGMEAAVLGQGLQPGLDVVIKGNERLKPGQPVMTTK